MYQVLFSHKLILTVLRYKQNECKRSFTVNFWEEITQFCLQKFKNGEKIKLAILKYKEKMKNKE